jgi:threonine aldolase
MIKYSFILLSEETDGFLNRLQELGVVDVTRSAKPIDDCSAAMLDSVATAKRIIGKLEAVDYSKDADKKAIELAYGRAIADKDMVAGAQKALATLAELEAISDACKRSGFYLFLDGARLGYALTATGNDITLADYARLCDVFYIGGTKCGAMFGEAVVIANHAIAHDFRHMIKQRGAMLAKGWLLGLQYEALFEEDLYFKITAQANEKADRLRKVLHNLEYPLLVPGNTNQVFPILPNSLLEKLSREFTFLTQEYVDDNHTAVRFCTSWATTEESITALCNALQALSSGRE